MQCHGNGGAGRPDLRLWWIRWKLIPQLRGVLFSRNKQVRALGALKLVRLSAAGVGELLVPCRGTAGRPGCERNAVNGAEKPRYPGSGAASPLARLLPGCKRTKPGFKSNQVVRGELLEHGLRESDQLIVTRGAVCRAGADLSALPARWTVVTPMSSNRSAAGVTVFEGRIYVSGGHDGLQIFNSVSPRGRNSSP